MSHAVVRCAATTVAVVLIATTGADAGTRRATPPARVNTATPRDTGAAGREPPAPVADSRPQPHRPSDGAPRSGTGPPLVGPASGATPAEPSARGERDPLVGNGLTSPLCESSPTSGRLAPSAAADCETSGFVAAPAPTGDYGLDVHIDTGLFGLSEGGLLSAVQDLLIEPPWMALVWAVHGVMTVLQWGFTVDLLDSPGSGLGAGLRSMQANLTAPWLAFALAVAAVLLAYHGLVRRRVGESLGQAIAMVLMIAGSLWVIANPTGTVGAVASLAEGASLGALAVAATGSPAEPREALSAAMTATFAAAVEAPWCYLEFGDVAWCLEPRYMDARLRSAGLAIAESEDRSANCGEDPLHLGSCAAAGSAKSKALQLSARLLRGARTNGALFLALPANGGDRNSINDEGSLLRTLCASSDATHCHGATAAQAEFRTNSGTWARLAGLVMIVVGVLGLLLLLGFIGMRLLAAALMSLALLLLAPAVALAPAFGERGRELFRRWALSLLGALLAKLLFGFLLGVVLAVGGVLFRLRALGWWTEWLLTSAFWWTAFGRRHHTLALLAPGSGAAPARGSAVRRARDVIEIRRRLKDQNSKDCDRGAAGRPGGGRGERSGAAGATEVAVAAEAAGRRASPGAGHSQREPPGETSGREEPSRRVEEADRSPSTSAQAPHVEHGGRFEQQALAARDESRVSAPSPGSAEAPPGNRAPRDQPSRSHGERPAARAPVGDDGAAFLVHQASLPPGGQPGAAGQRRDYSRLAELKGYTPEVYRELPAQRARELNSAIDDELARRREGLARLASRSLSSDDEQAEAPQAPDDPESFARPGAHRPAAAEIDPVMADAREVEAGRKRQLGFGYD